MADDEQQEQLDAALMPDEADQLRRSWAEGDREVGALVPGTAPVLLRDLPTPEDSPLLSMGVWAVYDDDLMRYVSDTYTDRDAAQAELDRQKHHTGHVLVIHDL